MNRRDMLKYAALGSGAVLLQPYTNLFGLNLPNVTFTRKDFGDDFKWGVATAAYQIEGPWNKDAKGPSVWDTFTHTKGKIKNGETGDVACNFYEHYEQDIALIKEMNLGVFRFSIAWSRVIPDGDGKINDVGINFYHRVIDACIEQGVEPWITLYHWDLPQALEDKGGWANREVVDWFSYYADIVTKEYGDGAKRTYGLYIFGLYGGRSCTWQTKLEKIHGFYSSHRFMSGRRRPHYSPKCRRCTYWYNFFMLAY